MAGMTSHKVTVGIYNTETQKTVYLNTGDPTDRYFTNISWSPDEKSLYLIEVNRDQNHAKLCQYNAETGEPMGVLYEEILGRSLFRIPLARGWSVKPSYALTWLLPQLLPVPVIRDDNTESQVFPNLHDREFLLLH